MERGLKSRVLGPLRSGVYSKISLPSNHPTIQPTIQPTNPTRLPIRNRPNFCWNLGFFWDMSLHFFLRIFVRSEIFFKSEIFFEIWDFFEICDFFYIWDKFISFIELLNILDVFLFIFVPQSFVYSFFYPHFFSPALCNKPWEIYSVINQPCVTSLV